MDPNKKAITLTMGNITPQDLLNLAMQISKTTGTWLPDGLAICSKNSPHDPWQVHLCPSVKNGELGKTLYYEANNGFDRGMESFITKRFDRGEEEIPMELEAEPNQRRPTKFRR